MKYAMMKFTEFFGELILYSILMKQITSKAKLSYKLLFNQK